ncbi:MAG: PcfJ domain-containing protein [Ruminococcus sp.]
MADLSGRPFVCTGSDEPGTDKKLFGKTGKRKRKKPKELIGTWQDYLDMALKLGMDVKDPIIYRVRKLEKRHNELVQLMIEKKMDIKAEEIAEKFPGIENVCENLRKYEYSDHTFQIVAPRKIKDILEEGEELQHCIIGKDTYFARMVKQESYLLFPRKRMHPKSHIIHWKWNQMGQYARNGHILTGRTRILSRPRNFYCVGRNSFRVN